MSSPPFGFSWRGRTQSVSSQGSQEDAQSRTLSPPNIPTGDARGVSIPPAPSTSQRDPIRSFVHGSFRERLTPVNSAQHARTVREDTAELATYQLSDGSERRGRSFLTRQRSGSVNARQDSNAEHEATESSEAPSSRIAEPIQEVSEPNSPEEREDHEQIEGPSLIARMLKMSPQDAEAAEDPEGEDDVADGSATARRKSSQAKSTEDQDEEPTETTSLLRTTSRGTARQPSHNGAYDVEGQKRHEGPTIVQRIAAGPARLKEHVVTLAHSLQDPKRWDRRALWESAVVAPVMCLPAVVVGLLLNILDALSYGMILFPLSSPIFANLGSAGISMFYVSTIVSQLTFSCGSIFRGGIGSELIEVVPFFHSMAAKITKIVGEDQPDAVIATTITSYALSSMMTGLVFYLMGKLRFGYLVGFIPRHILIGCIGGVGWFLVATGFEVSARIDGSFNYDLDTLNKLMSPDTVPLWVTPLALAIILFYSKTKIDNKYFLSLYILAIPFVFYFFVLSLDQLDTDSLRDKGWIFDGPPADEPWWYFYTLYQFRLVHWGAIAECIPAMLALTFFGILHVPINVPALAFAAGEDYVDLNHELKLHGYSNFLSGSAGSIQNYLVYANTVFFMRAGGDSRLAGFELAALTFGVMLVGPKIIGFIPVMMVGCLIFVLGFELLEDAVWMPRKKLKLPEYLTVIAIVLIMGIYDFVVGIGVGIILAFVSMILQTSRVSAVRASWSGEIIKSAVRRNPSQQHYLHQVGQQIYVIKLAGFLFFGTIVSVEESIRGLIGEEAFRQRPIRYLILDLTQVTGLDYSAGEAFNRISRLLENKGIELALSGLDTDSKLGRDLRAVGLGENGTDVQFLPDLNSALESCENQLLMTLYASHDELEAAESAPTAYLDVPSKDGPSSTSSADAQLASSPRRSHLRVAAQESLKTVETPRLSKWQNFREPLRLMLQIFEDVSGKNEDFWFPAVPYFSRIEHPQGTVLFRVGEPAEGFYLLERGIIRAEYTLPHGQQYHESIVAGTTCGELPFFSETHRTATARVEKGPLVAWALTPEAWRKLQRELPDVAQELLRVSLKLTAERMATVPSSTMLMAQ